MKNAQKVAKLSSENWDYVGLNCFNYYTCLETFT